MCGRPLLLIERTRTKYLTPTILTAELGNRRKKKEEKKMTTKPLNNKTRDASADRQITQSIDMLLLLV